MRQRVAAWMAICISLAAPAHALEPQPIRSFSLKNGMEVIVVENHRVPAVSHILWFRVGAADDPPGKSGLAHFHEHMMFQGTQAHAKGEYADIIARHGGQQNAFTGHDATAYYVNIAKEYLPLAMELEAERMKGLEPKDDDATKEREVIIEERRSRIENNPQALFAEQMQAALFLNHPYHIPVIGWKHEMEGLEKDDVLDLHRDHYHAGNAVLIVSGDITEEELKPLAEKYYGNLPAGPAHKRVWKSEPPHLAARRISMTHANVKQPFWQRVYMAPSVREGKTELAPALFVLEHMLGGGRTSRLYQALVVRDKIAADIGADYDGFSIGPATLTLSVVPVAQENLLKVEAALDAEITRLLRDGVTPDELARAKTLLKADTLYAREGLQSMAYIIGWIRAVGLPVEYYEKWPDMIDAVTAEQVREAAQAVFVSRQSVTGVLLPEEGTVKHAR